MNLFSKLTAFVVFIALVLSLVSCLDLGAGENEDDFKKYFSGVYVLSTSGAQKYSIADFNREIEMNDMDIPAVVPSEEYCYIGFRVAKGYTVSISEFAFFARSESGGELELEFYIVDKMPTNIKGEDGEDVEKPPLDEDESATPGQDTVPGDGDVTEDGTEADTDISEDEVFDSLANFHTSTFTVNENWDSVLLEFDGSKTAKSEQYVVVRIKNNCFLSNDDEDGEEQQAPSVSFTFNYLLFHFTDAHKE